MKNRDFCVFLYVLLRGSEKPCFFIVFYNKVLKKSSFLAFFGHFLEANLGPQRVIFSLFWTLGVGSPLSGLGWSGLGAGLGVPFSGRLGTPNPGTRFCTYSWLYYTLLRLYILTTHFYSFSTHYQAIQLTFTHFLLLYPLSFHFSYFTHFTRFIHLLTLLLL